MIEMNDRSATTKSTCATQRGGGEVANVKSLQHRHSLIVADPRMELAVTYVEGNDMVGATLEQAIGESTRRGAGVEHSPTGRRRWRTSPVRRRASHHHG